MITFCRPYLQRLLLCTNNGVTDVQVIVISKVASVTAPLPGQRLVALDADKDYRLSIAQVAGSEAEGAVED